MFESSHPDKAARFEDRIKLCGLFYSIPSYNSSKASSGQAPTIFEHDLVFLKAPAKQFKSFGGCVVCIHHRVRNYASLVGIRVIS